MNNEKIGKFIADCRKEKHFTQAQLAEMLNITDRAVSKWERGRSLPDVSIMQQLCSLLGISVNELLNGERIDMNEFNERTEQLLMEMVKKEEISNKRFLMYETVIGLFSTVILLSSIVVASFVQMQMYFRISLIAFGCAIFLTGIIFALKIETDAGYYECRHCIDKDGGTLHSHQDVWKPLIDKSKVSSSLMAALIDYKFNLGLPYYSIEQRLMEDNIVIPRANMSNWMIQMMKYINPLYDMMHQDLLNKEIIAADETAMYVLREEGKKPASSSYLWQYRTCNDEEEISLFEYQPTRSGDVPKKSLEGFNGILLSDKYNGYSKVEKATRAYCHGHSYRYLRDALAILPKESRSSSLEQKAVKKYQKIFITDKKIHDKAARLHPNDKEAYYNYVQEHRVETLKLFQEFLVWLKTIKEEVYMKPKFLEAIKYILNGEEGFKAFIKNPRVELTNNGAERDFRKWVVNRTRSRFYVSTRGAEAASKLYSLMMTAKNNGYNVYSYFDYLFDKIRYEDLNNQETLKKYLPYKKQIPEYCKMQTVKEIRTRIKALEDNQ